MSSDWGPPPPPGAFQEGTPITAESPSYLFGAISGGLVAGVLAAFAACCCGIFSGPIGGALAAWGTRKRSAVFGLKEGAYAGFLASLVATVAFSLIFIPMTVMNGNRIQKQGLNQAERDLIQRVPWVSEQQLVDQAVANASPPMVVLMVIANGGLLFLTCVLGGMAIGGIFPKAVAGYAPAPGPPQYRHPHGPPPGVPEPYAAPGFDEKASDEPKYSTAWKEVPPEELDLPITLEGEGPKAPQDDASVPPEQPPEQPPEA